VEVRHSSQLRRLKYVETGLWVVCKPLFDPQGYHLFLSHAWPAAQDRMHAVKARLLECLPSCRTFLDVDDLKSGSGTAELDKSGCVLVFCTLPYFEKRNSFKELYRAVCQGKYILAMLEPDATQQGGLNQEAMQALITNVKLKKMQLHELYNEARREGTLLPGALERPPAEDDVRTALFKTPPVEWNRLPHFQDVTIRLIAQRGVFRGNAPASSKRRWTVRGFFGSQRASKPSRRPSLGAPVDASSELYLQDETARVKVSLSPPLSGRKHHLFCSEFNAGALSLATELSESDVFVTKGKKASAALSFTTDVDELADCDHMLILLDKRTWTSGADTAQFVEHIHLAMRVGVHISCVHELPAVVGPHRYACDFALMFNDEWTPAHLTGGPTNLYKEINLALKGEEWRQPGLVALAATLATSAREHKPIDTKVPASYKPKTGANPWPEADDVASGSRARVRGRARGNSLVEDDSACWLVMSESSLAAHKAGDTRAGGENLFADAGGAVSGPRAVPQPVDAANASAAHENRMSEGAAAAMVAPPVRPAPPPRPADSSELVSLPPPTSGLVAAAPTNATQLNSTSGEQPVAVAPPPADSANVPFTDYLSHRLKGMFSAPEASQSLEA